MRLNRFKLSVKLTGLSGALMLLSGCAGFTGLRSPHYDGGPIEPDEEAIERYSESAQVDEAFEGIYRRYPLSSRLREDALDFSDAGSFELNEGEYSVGEDLPEGRVYIQSESSDFRPEFWIIHTAHVVIRDEADSVAFDQHFQNETGVMQAYVDLREGYTVEVSGNDPILYVDYSGETGSNWVNTGLGEEQITLTSGHYSVGTHLSPGKYTIESATGPRASELYLLSENDEVAIIELHSRMNPAGVISAEDNQSLLERGQITPEIYEMNEMQRQRFEEDKPVIDLNEGDVLYLPMVDQLLLEEK
ncbi:hypothetical protein IRB23SM22_03530 [Alkalibacterium sp. s-m-22]